MTSHKQYPQFTLHWKTGHGVLTEDIKYRTPIKDLWVTTHDYIQLDPDGGLLLKAGYVWDFGSGPAVDTPDMIYGSLAHDAFYECMVLELLPWDIRKDVDKYFKGLLKEAGMGWLRRQWVYAGVRWGYPITKALGFMGSTDRKIAEG